MNKRKLYFIFVLALVIGLNFLALPSHALPEASYEFYTYDEAGVIDQDVENYIINTNKDLYERTGAQIVVATVNDLENMDINLYAVKLFEKWKIGSRETDNGILMLLVPNERQIWIETGYGAEGIFPASITKRIIEDHMKPYFIQERYSDGILAGFNEFKRGFEEEYGLEIDASKDINNPLPIQNNTDRETDRTRVFIIIGIIILFIIDFRFLNGMLTYSMMRGMGRGGGGYRGGGGGGGSRGGGGRSGGGGAGGSW